MVKASDQFNQLTKADLVEYIADREKDFKPYQLKKMKKEELVAMATRYYKQKKEKSKVVEEKKKKIVEEEKKEPPKKTTFSDLPREVQIMIFRKANQHIFKEKKINLIYKKSVEAINDRYEKKIVKYCEENEIPRFNNPDDDENEIYPFNTYYREPDEDYALREGDVKEFSKLLNKREKQILYKLYRATEKKLGQPNLRVEDIILDTITNYIDGLKNMDAKDFDTLGLTEKDTGSLAVIANLKKILYYYNFTVISKDFDSYEAYEYWMDSADKAIEQNNMVMLQMIYKYHYPN